MKYITAKQFLKADKKVQEAILQWWKPSVGDIYCNIYNNQENNILVINECNFNFSSFSDDIKRYGLPLLTEGQLIEFIEDKTTGKIDLEYDFGLGYTIMIYFNDRSKSVLDFTGYGLQLLQALWQVANEIIK